jgi:hypothetical protein
LTRRELRVLVKIYAEHGQAFAAQALNALAAPAGDACGGRQYAPEFVEASRSLHGDVSAGKGSGRLVVQYGPVIGVACRQANSVRCDRLGFDVVLEKPAITVTASIAGLPIQVLTPGPTPHRAGAQGKDWGGFLQHAGLTRSSSLLYIHTHGSRDYWAGEPPVQADIRITATYASGRSISETFRRVSLGAGWG